MMEIPGLGRLYVQEGDLKRWRELAVDTLDFANGSRRRVLDDGNRGGFSLSSEPLAAIQVPA